LLVCGRRLGPDAWKVLAAHREWSCARVRDQHLRVGDEVVDHEQGRALGADRQLAQMQVGMQVEVHIRADA
jgi:hypothetical protein